MYWLTLLVCAMYLWDGINEVNAKNNTSNNGNSDNTDIEADNSHPSYN